VIFFIWRKRIRADCPELGLHAQLLNCLMVSEALYYGGLLLMIDRYPDMEAVRVGISSIMMRFLSKLLDRAGIIYYASSCMWPNKMDRERDLVGRVSCIQSWLNLLLPIILIAPVAYLKIAEVMYGISFKLVFDRSVCFPMFAFAGLMGVFTEFCVAALTWHQRRGRPKQLTLWQTLKCMTEPGMQPYFQKRSQLLGAPADRAFESQPRLDEVTDTIRKLPFLTEKEAVMVFAFSLSLGGYSFTVMNLITEAS